MIVQVHTNGMSAQRDGLTQQAEAEVTEALDKFAHQITRLEVHLGDENGHKGGDSDKRCTIEARLDNRPPSAVTNHAGTIEEALTGAAEKMRRQLESALGRLRDARSPGHPDPAGELAGKVEEA